MYLFYEEGQRGHFVQQSQLPSRALGVCMERTHTQVGRQGDSGDRDRINGYRDEERMGGKKRR